MALKDLHPPVQDYKAGGAGLRLDQLEFDTDFIAEFASVATRENLSKDVLRPPAAGVVGAGHQHGHQAGRGDRQARRVRGDAAPGATPVHQPVPVGPGTAKPSGEVSW
ncbi:hypothetical protein [Streptomyces sp. CCM_MD2014]|uniref:hypothetical protein n=1 Tax=Streptomyces sp. CCM_MD2014 TaxID=1561022 RepID=UPI000A4C28D4|nr:hypothetical protein [Streptomyces sp. CCM_MD2014]